ncbi:MAG: helix-turn-helix domain-containing protein [Candidatus Dormibacteria bacterium]
MTQAQSVDDRLNVREAALLVSRSPETIRRWVWSGALSVKRDGRRLLVSRQEVRALADEHGHSSGLTLPEWAEAARRAMVAAEVSRPESAADLVLLDRRHHL